jgi:hypothetical protein
MIEKLRMWSIGLRERSRAVHKTAKPIQRKLISRSDVKARGAVLQLKKRHVESLTRLPTERLATACWDFIVVKRTAREPAPVLVFRPLRGANMETYQQNINNSLASCGQPTTAMKWLTATGKYGPNGLNSKRLNTEFSRLPF